MSTNAAAEVHCTAYGATAEGDLIDLYVLTSPQLEVKIINYGARLVAVRAPGRDGARANVVLGYGAIEEYEEDKSYFGAIVGRYANRISRGRFTLNGHACQIPQNNGANALHGGKVGFSQRIWDSEIIPNGVELRLTSDDGDQGFPGTLNVRCRYTLQGSSLHIDITAETDADTVVNLTNHAYFNLAGEGNGTILDHVVTIPADRFVAADKDQIPTGELLPVEGTPFDFRTPHTVGERIETPGDQQLQTGLGYDHTYVISGQPGTLRQAGKVTHSESGRTLTVLSTQPGVHFYTGNHLTGTTKASNGETIQRRGWLCLETQHFPDSPNHPDFPSTLLRPGETFRETTIYTFSVE